MALWYILNYEFLLLNLDQAVLRHGTLPQEHKEEGWIVDSIQEHCLMLLCSRSPLPVTSSFLKHAQVETGFRVEGSYAIPVFPATFTA